MYVFSKSVTPTPITNDGHRHEDIDITHITVSPVVAAVPHLQAKQTEELNDDYDVQQQLASANLGPSSIDYSRLQ